MRTYVVTGVSGCGRIECLKALSDELVSRGHRVNVLDVGTTFVHLAQSVLSSSIVPERVLDIDGKYQKLLCTMAMKEIRNDLAQSVADFNFIGLHATFRWRGRLMPGVCFEDLAGLRVDGFLNVIDHVEGVLSTNSSDAQWGELAPDLAETQDWMMEEEFVTEVLSSVFGAPCTLIAREHDVCNLADYFTTDKVRAYLSYPITAIRGENPELLEEIRTSLVPALREQLVVFDPLTIRDMELAGRGTYQRGGASKKLSAVSRQKIEARTIERDYQFIDQSQIVVVAYLTDKNSAGVMSEIKYAAGLNKPVIGVFLKDGGPFLRRNTSHAFGSIDDLLQFVRSDEFGKELASR